MDNVTDREKYERINNQLWQRSKVDKYGRVTLPKTLRQKLGIEGKNAVVLWIQIKQKNSDNLFNIEVGVKK